MQPKRYPRQADRGPGVTETGAWDVGTKNPTRGPRSHTTIAIDPSITPQRAWVRNPTWHSGTGLHMGGLACRNKHRGKQGDVVLIGDTRL